MNRREKLLVKMLAFGDTWRYCQYDAQGRNSTGFFDFLGNAVA
jgi:hypothetical protein